MIFADFLRECLFLRFVGFSEETALLRTVSLCFSYMVRLLTLIILLQNHLYY